jgi:hypothetical protein
MFEGALEAVEQIAELAYYGAHFTGHARAAHAPGQVGRVDGRDLGGDGLKRPASWWNVTVLPKDYRALIIE